MLAAVRKVSGDLVGAGKVAASANHSRVDVEMPLVIDKLEGTVKEEVSGAALDCNGRKAANKRLPAAGQVKLDRDNIAELESSQWRLARAACCIRAANG